MRSFYLCWPPEQISQTASAKSPPSLISQTLSAIFVDFDLAAVAQVFRLPWSAYVRLLSVKNPAARHFYETEALRSGWSVRQLDRQISSQFYERIALSNNKAAMLKKVEHGDELTPEQAIKDPFVLEFLNLKDEYSESDLEDALLIRNS
ncbi:hypothetical protein DFQ28_004616 [Apophysomyces sp. BC1034]|nr:hypothetical protein DFQ30_005426 [Apophysomyces sp. BC1015]KAG0176710.1 hypothetical protein DFQ28_004616 [Apophysomyces sp. BC1034]